MVIGEKLPREDHSSLPSTKDKIVNSPKGKEATIVLEPKRKTTKPGDAAYSGATPSSKPREGNSPSLGTVLGPGASIMGNPSIAEKILWGVIPPIDKEKVEKLSLDQMATRLFHVIGQVLPQFCT